MEEALEAGVPPERIAFLTFTRGARQEAVDRAVGRFGFDRDQLPYFRTLHAIAFKELDMAGSALVKGPQDMKEFAELAGLEFAPRRTHSFDEDELDFLSGPATSEADQMLAFSHYHRHAELTPEQAHRAWPHDLDWYALKRFLDAYDKWKRREGLVDFTDLLTRARGPLPVDVVFVDEAQDLSRLQWRVLDRLARDAERSVLAGDDDQAIFTWAGADPEAFLARPGEVRVLGQSYRLPRAVHGLADRMARRLAVRQHKEWAPRPDDGEVRYLPDEDYLRFEGDGDWLVLYRTHRMARRVEEQLRHLGLPYHRHGQESPASVWGPAIVSWERLRAGKLVRGREAQAVYEAMTVGHGIAKGARKGVGAIPHDAPVSMATLRESHGLLTDAPWYEAFRRMSDADGQYLRSLIRTRGASVLTEEPKIRLSTIHAAKGGEADNVVLLTGLSPTVREHAERDPDPERRVFYVGVTRAKHTLTLVGDDNPLF